MNILFANNAKTLLDGTLAIGGTTVTVDDASKFPSPAGEQFFYATIQNPEDDEDFEIVKCTAVSGNDITIERAQEDTLAQEWPDGFLFELRVTAGAIDELKAHEDDHLSGGSAEIDGDKLDIDWNPSYYVPATDPSEVDDEDQLSAHLYGIDQLLKPAGQTHRGTIEIATHTEAKEGTETGKVITPSTLTSVLKQQSWRQESGYYIGTDKVRARGSDGLDLEDDGGNGIHIANGGEATFDENPIMSALTASKLIATDASKNLESIEPTVFETDGEQEIDGDKLDIDFTPANYSPDTTPAEADNVDNLAAHLAGIDNAIGQWYGLAWNESSDNYTRCGSLAGVATGSKPADALIPIQAAMRRCVLNDAGEVVYYLDPADSTKKEGGGTANLDGTDGQVMVQIPKFYYRYAYASNTHYWDISSVPRDGFSLHPAFQKNGEIVDYRYIGAYEGSMYDDSAGSMVADADVVTAMYAAGDKLCSISGQYPKTNETRAEFRAMAAARGTGWREFDWYLLHAAQLLYLIEYADFDSQAMISNGRTMFENGSWEAANQGNGMYIGQTGYSNGDGNASGGSSRSSALDIAAIDTSDAAYQDYMSYRGIENLFGNVWTWIDGINVNDNVPYFCNDDTDFADDTDSDYYAPGVTLYNANDYPTTLAQIPDGFLAAAGGGSDSTYLCDYYYQHTGWRVVRFGGAANSTLKAGAFFVNAYHASSSDNASFGGRLCF